MGAAKVRRQNDPGYGRVVVATKVERSKLTSKWLVMASVNGGEWLIVTPHFKREDAEAACPEVERVFSRYKAGDWERGRCLLQAVQELGYEDDDEVLGVVRFLKDGTVVVDTREHTLANQRAVWAEHGLISDTVLGTLSQGEHERLKLWKGTD
jgi:hypothetical protein